MEPFLECQFNFFRDFGPLTPTKNARIRHVGVRGEDMSQVWWERSNSLPSPLVIKRLVYLVFWMLLSGESKEKKNQVRFNTKQNCKNMNGECISISDSLISGWSPVYWSEVLFDDKLWRCLEVNIPLQTVLFFLFWSKLSSEYKRIFVGPLLQCEITILRSFGL